MGRQNRQPWGCFDLGDDRPIICADCYRMYLESTYEERAVFRIGLSTHGIAYLNGATVIDCSPPPGATCRNCGEIAA